MRTNHKTLVVIGCGGLAYQAVPRLRTWMRLRDIDRVVTVDPDTLEEGNFSRQWTGHRAGEDKATLMLRALGSRGQAHCTMLGDEAMTLGNDVANASRWVAVMVLTDNHYSRVGAARWADRLSREVPVVYMTAGNNEQGGWAIGSAVKDGLWEYWPFKRLVNVLREGIEEKAAELAMARGLRDEGGCGALPETENQSAQTNGFTAQVLMDVADRTDRIGPTYGQWMVQDDTDQGQWTMQTFHKKLPVQMVRVDWGVQLDTPVEERVRQLLEGGVV